MFLPLLIAIVIGYLLGSLPCGYLVAKAKGVNIFEVGSKSPGATNVRRVLGNGPGNLVFVLDAFKGVLAAGWPSAFARAGEFAPQTPGNHADFIFFITSFGSFPAFDNVQTIELAVLALGAALLGHSYSCFTKFRGGKGVATTAGGFLVLMPCVLAIALTVWLLTFQLSRFVSLASILAALSLPVAAFFLGEPPLLLGLSLLIAGFVVLRHRANIVRLLNGTENRFTRKSAEPPGSAQP